MAKHRAEDTTADTTVFAVVDSAGGPVVSTRVLVFLSVAATMLISGVVWAVVGGTGESRGPLTGPGPFSSLPVPPPGSPAGPRTLSVATRSLPGTPSPITSDPGTPSPVSSTGPLPVDAPSGDAPESPVPSSSRSPGVRPPESSRPVSSPAGSPAPSAAPAGALTAGVSISRWWGGWMTLRATITTGGVAVSGWRLVLTFSSDIRVVNLWDAQVQQPDDRTVVLTPKSDDALVAPGQQVSPGLVAFGGNDLVTCTINGVPCAGDRG